MLADIIHGKEETKHINAALKEDGHIHHKFFPHVRAAQRHLAPAQLQPHLHDDAGAAQEDWWGMAQRQVWLVQY